MKHIILYSAFFFSFLSISFAQLDVISTEEKVVSEVIDTSRNSLLWEISGNGLEKPSYLYGTIHMIAKEDFFITDNTQKAIDKSSRITFEINMEKMNDMSMMFSMMFSMISNAFMKDGGSLKKLLSKEDYSMVAKHFSEIGLPIAFFDKVKPMFTSMMASTDMYGGNPMTGQEGIVSYEVEFLEIAKEQEMEVEGLETVEYQMSMFDSIPYDMQAEMLVEAIKGGGEETAGASELDKMVELYKAQDLKGLSAMISSEEGGMGNFEEILLVNRNKNWIPIMQEQMKSEVTFFAVGAGHLGGEFGVINLLINEGFELKPLR